MLIISGIKLISAIIASYFLIKSTIISYKSGDKEKMFVESSKSILPFIVNKYKDRKLSRSKNFNIPFNNFLDIGAGYASVCIQAKNLNFAQNITGIEIQKHLYYLGKLNIKISELFSNWSTLQTESQIEFFNDDLFKFDIKKYDCIYCFFSKEFIKKVEQKLLKECSNGTIVIAWINELPLLKKYLLYKDLIQIQKFTNNELNLYIYRISK